MKNMLAIVVAVGLGLAAVVMVRDYIARTTAEAVGPIVEVILVRAEVPAGTQLTLEHLAKAERPRRNLDPDAVPAGQLTEVLGQRLSAPKGAETILRWSDMHGGVTGERSLARLVPRGKRAVTLNVDSLSGFSGMLRPGDKVDILLQHTPANELGSTGAPKTVLQYMLSNLTVLALDRTTGHELRGMPVLHAGTRREGQFGTVTFAVRPVEAEVLIFAESQGQTRFLLRNPEDDQAAEGIVPVDSENFREVLGAVATGR